MDRIICCRGFSSRPLVSSGDHVFSYSIPSSWSPHSRQVEEVVQQVRLPGQEFSQVPPEPAPAVLVLQVLGLQLQLELRL